jgi:tetrahydromethanopterin S-methyltransferase subunit B
VTWLKNALYSLYIGARIIAVLVLILTLGSANIVLRKFGFMKNI